jgi:DNA-binding response OmpR family regulator
MWSSERAEQTVIVVCSPVDAQLELICEWLVEHGYSPLPAATAAAAARLCRYTRPPLLVVDLDLPADSGLELLRGSAEADRSNVSVLLLIDGGFDFKPLMRRDPLLAVDDILRKPFDLDELGGRIAAILRRRHSRGDAVVRVGELLVDPPRRKVLVGDREVRLARKEFALLRVLASDPTHVFSKDELMVAVWGLRHPGGGTRTLDSHASRLRTKLDPESRRFVVVAWGIGYRLVESIAAAGPVRPGVEEQSK